MKVWVVRTIRRWQEPFPRIWEELKRGWARIAWSQRDDSDLRILDEHIRAGGPLDRDQRETKKCLPFFTKITHGDYLLYPHQPAPGQFAVVRVTGDYDFDDSTWGFRSRRPCEFIATADMHDEIVPSLLRQRLGLQGRLYQIHDVRPFKLFLEALPEAGRRQDGSNRAPIRRIHNDLRQQLPDSIHREFAKADLSRQFCRDLFDRMGYAYEVQEGRSERGSDVVVSVGDPLLPEGVAMRVGVQVFSYTGKVETGPLRNKLEQLLRGWEDNTLDYGLLLTTGTCTPEAREEVDKHNRENHDRENPKLVRLIEGDDLADLFLQHFPPGSETD